MALERRLCRVCNPSFPSSSSSRHITKGHTNRSSEENRAFVCIYGVIAHAPLKMQSPNIAIPGKRPNISPRSSLTLLLEPQLQKWTILPHFSLSHPVSTLTTKIFFFPSRNLIFFSMGLTPDLALRAGTVKTLFFGAVGLGGSARPMGSCSSWVELRRRPASRARGARGPRRGREGWNDGRSGIFSRTGDGRIG